MATLHILEKYLSNLKDDSQKHQIYIDIFDDPSVDILKILTLDVATDYICKIEELVSKVVNKLKNCVVKLETFDNFVNVIDKFITKLYVTNNEVFLKLLDPEIEFVIFCVSPNFFFELCSKNVISFKNILINIQNNQKDVLKNIMNVNSNIDSIKIINHITKYDDDDDFNKLKHGFEFIFSKKFVNKVSDNEIKEMTTKELTKLLKLIKNPSVVMDYFVIFSCKVICELLQRDDLDSSDYETMFNPSFKWIELFKPGVSESDYCTIIKIFHKLSKETVKQLCSNKSSKFSDRRFVIPLLNHCAQSIKSFNDSCYGSIINNYQTIGKINFFIETTELFPHNLCENTLILVQNLIQYLSYVFSDDKMKTNLREVFMFPKNLEFNSMTITDFNLIDSLKLWKFVNIDLAKNIINDSGFKCVTFIPDDIVINLFNEEHMKDVLNSDKNESFLMELSICDNSTAFYKNAMKSLQKVLNYEGYNKILARIMYTNRKILNRSLLEILLTNNDECCKCVYEEHLNKFRSLASKYINICPNHIGKISFDMALDILYPESVNNSFGICKICDQENVSVVFSGCGHVLCGKCVGRLKMQQCPFCRSAEPKIKLYF